MDLLSNREWAILTWLTALFLYVRYAPRMKPVRESTLGVIKRFFVWQIQSVLILALFYVSIVVYFLHESNLWHVGQLKNTVIWFSAVAFLSLFEIENYKKDSGLLKNAVLDNIKLVALIEFLIGYYVLSFWAELILFPTLVLTTLIHAYSQTDKRYKRIEKLFGAFLAIFCFLLIIYALYQLTANLLDFAKPETAEDFLLPPLLTFTYLPFIFFLVVYTTYENIFLRLRFSVEDKWVRRFTKIYAVIVFNLRIKELERWIWMLQVRDIKTIRDVFKAWRDFKDMRMVEKKPPSIPRNEGWSPYSAQEFLKDYGIETGHYKELHGDWFASAPYVEFGIGLIPANITYYIDGNSRAARSLKVAVNINDPKGAEISRDKMLGAAETLFQKSTNHSLPNKVKEAIIKEENLEISYDLHHLSFEKDIWPNHSLNGYTLRFCISMQENARESQIG